MRPLKASERGAGHRWLLAALFTLTAAPAFAQQGYSGPCTLPTQAAEATSARVLYDTTGGLFISVYPQVCKKQCAALAAGCRTAAKAAERCGVAAETAYWRAWHALCTNYRGKEAEKACRNSTKLALADATTSLHTNATEARAICTDETAECKLACKEGAYVGND